MPASQFPPVSSARTTGPAFTLPSHPSFSEFLGINDLGDVAVVAGAGRRTEAYVGHKPYGQRDFKATKYPGAVTTTITAVSNQRLVVGFYITAKGKIAALTLQKGVWTHYEGGGDVTEYLGINGAGIAVGFYGDRRGRDRAFAENLKTGKIAHIQPPEASSAVASAVNDGGAIVGYMTTSRGRVESFIRNSGSITRFSYPGAAATRALGVSKDGRIVGSYDDARGATHGFIVRDLATRPQWKTYDDPKARDLTVLTGINAHGDIVGYYRDEQSRMRGLVISGIGPPPGLPLVIPVWGVGAGDPGSTDPGPVPDQHLFAVVFDDSEVSSSSVANNCPGVSSTSTCQPYKYTDFFVLHCNTVNSLAAYQWADANDEAAFLHTYPNGLSWGNRITYQETPNSTCTPDNNNASPRMNPADSGYNTWLYNNYWNGTNYTNDVPSPYGVMEDEASTPAWTYVGGYGTVTTEFGSGTNPSGFANQIGNSQYNAGTDFESAIGTFANGACGSKCVDVAFNGPAPGSGNIDACSVISNGHCHAHADSGNIDDQAAFDNICKTVANGNFKYLVAERPLFMGRFGLGFLNYTTMTYDINTYANLYSHASDGCATTKIADLEPSYGLGGPGDITGGYRVRLLTLAAHWLVPNPSTGIPDRVLSYQMTEDGTSGEVAYFFEDTLVPYGAETKVAKFLWNGKTQTVGSGCPSVQGDSGGAVSVVVQCVGSAGIFCQQYQHLYINGADYGRAAACLNTSTSTENIVSSWFKNDPISSYQYELSLQGGEMASVPYKNVQGGSIPITTCTSKTYCTGQNTLSTQVAPFKGDGSDQLCGQCGVILLQND